MPVKREAGLSNLRRALIGSNKLWRVNDSSYYVPWVGAMGCGRICGQPRARHPDPPLIPSSPRRCQIAEAMWPVGIRPRILLPPLVCQGLPYIPRVHLSEGSLVRSPLRWLCSEEPMVRRSFIPKFLYSESCYVPKIPYSERPPTIWILCYEGSLVRSSSSPKVLCSELPYSENRPSPIRVLYYEGPFVRSPSSSKIAMFRRFYVPNFARSIRIVCCEGSLFWKF